MAKDLCERFLDVSTIVRTKAKLTLTHLILWYRHRSGRDKLRTRRDPMWVASHSLKRLIKWAQEAHVTVNCLKKPPCQQLLKLAISIQISRKDVTKIRDWLEIFQFSGLTKDKKMKGKTRLIQASLATWKYLNYCSRPIGITWSTNALCI